MFPSMSNLALIACIVLKTINVNAIFNFNSIFSAPTRFDPDQLPDDLIEFARTKLGVENVNAIPKVSELSGIFGSSSANDTIDIVRQLSSSESGIEFIKTFIETSEFRNRIKEESTTTEVNPIPTTTPTPNIKTDIITKDTEIIKKVLFPSNEAGFFSRIWSFLRLFDLFPQNEAITISPVNKEMERLKPNEGINHNVPSSTVRYELNSLDVAHNTVNLVRPFFVRMPQAPSISFVPQMPYPYRIIPRTKF